MVSHWKLTARNGVNEIEKECALRNKKREKNKQEREREREVNEQVDGSRLQGGG